MSLRVSCELEEVIVRGKPWYSKNKSSYSIVQINHIYNMQL